MIEEVVGILWTAGPAQRIPESRFRELGEQVSAAGNRISRFIRDEGMSIGRTLRFCVRYSCQEGG